MKALFALILSGAVASVAHGQAFTNLGFEEATSVPDPGGPGIQLLDWSTAVPGWGHSMGADTSVVYYGGTHVGQTQWFLLVDGATMPGGPLAGAYSLQFASGYSNFGSSTWVNAYVSQTGSVPTDAKSVTLLATGPLGITINGTDVPLVSLGGSAYGIDISPYAGLAVELKFINTSSEFFKPVTLDSVAFSTSPVPELPVWLMLGPASVLFALRGRERR